MGHGASEHTAPPAEVDEALAQRVAETMQALATPSRVRLLGQLRQAPATVGELAQAVRMEASAVSHQLRVLRHLGLVIGRRQGRNVEYALHDSHVAVLLDEAIGHVEHLALGVSDPLREAASSRPLARGSQRAAMSRISAPGRKQEDLAIKAP